MRERSGGREWRGRSEGGVEGEKWREKSGGRGVEGVRSEEGRRGVRDMSQVDENLLKFIELVVYSTSHIATFHM